MLHKHSPEQSENSFCKSFGISCPKGPTMTHDKDQGCKEGQRNKNTNLKTRWVPQGMNGEANEAERWPVTCILVVPHAGSSAQ